MEADLPHHAPSGVAVEDDLRRGLLLEDESDELVPLAPKPAPTQPTADAPSAAAPAAVGVLHPAMADSELVQRAVAWVCDPRPTWGVRRWVWFATGINLGVSRRERDLRLLFLALYATGFEMKEPV